MTSTALRRALIESDDPPLRRLPERAVVLLESVAAPPRLAAHLRLVHDVACELADWFHAHYPAVGFDREAMLFGAAIHDIGKVHHPAELSGPGSAHEQAGYELLRRHGVAEHLARFARTHTAWSEPGTGTEDLLVGLADKIWKARRVPDLEQLVVERIALAGDQEPWEAFLALDDLLDRLAATADRRLAFQARHCL